MNSCHFGKYGAIVNISLSQHNENYTPFDIGKQIAQHIVGMKPKSLGEMPPATVKVESPTTSSEQHELVKIDENETRLLHQEFLMKPNIRVLDFLREHNATLNDYVRFETGEIIDNEEQIV